MQITDGKLYLNRTWKYIYPALRVYGFQPIGYLNELVKQGVAISDINFEDEDNIPKIFILVQTKILKLKSPKLKNYDQKITDFFEFIRKQDYYIDDYLYDIGNKSCSHMVVLRMPESFISIYKHFKTGEYSKMYTLPQITKYFPLSNLNKNFTSTNVILGKSLGQNLEIHGVLKKDQSFKKEFIDKVNEDFGLTLTETEFSSDMELDYLPILEEELFNFKKEVKKIT